MNLKPDEDQSSSSRCQPQSDSEVESAERARFILIVEDNSADVTLIRQSLTLNGVGRECVVMTDGERGVEFIERIDAGAAACPDLVILDLNLPKKNGREVLQRIRASVVCRNVPVVVFSSSNAASDRDAAAALGANIYLRKPMDFEGFLEIGGVFKSFLKHPASY